MKHIKTWLCVSLTVALLALCLCGCGETGTGTASEPASAAESSLQPAARETASVVGIIGPTGVGLTHLMKAQEDGNTQVDYTFALESAPDSVVAKITSGEADIAAVPTNLAASLYQKTNGGVKMLAINTQGVLYFVENGATVSSVADLKGKTIYSTGQGANPEYILRYLLTKNGIDPDEDVTLEFLTENEELAAKLVKGEAQVALVPEPLCTTVLTKNADLRVAFSANDAWAETGADSSLLMGCVIARTEYIDAHPQAIAAFLEEYKASIEKAKTDLPGTAALCEQYGVIPAAAIAEKALPRCNLTFLAGADMQPAIEGYFDVLFNANPKSIGGKLPDAALYYVVGA